LLERKKEKHTAIHWTESMQATIRILNSNWSHYYHHQAIGSMIDIWPNFYI